MGREGGGRGGVPQWTEQRPLETDVPLTIHGKRDCGDRVNAFFPMADAVGTGGMVTGIMTTGGKVIASTVTRNSSGVNTRAVSLSHWYTSLILE